MDSAYKVRIIGDPVLRRRANEVTEIDGTLAKVADDMLDAMYAEPGIGLAAPQVGIEERFFVYDVGDGPETLINPVILESDGEWTYAEGCLSVPGLFWDLVRPKEILISGYDLTGEQVQIEADELLARLFQHEMDHLNGTLLVDHLDEEQRKEAMKTLRQWQDDSDNDPDEIDPNLGLSLP